jgi:hypothetical protein
MESLGIVTRGRSPLSGLGVATLGRSVEGFPRLGMTPFEARIDTQQGRIEPTITPAASGLRAMVLGSDFAGRTADLAPGDFVQVVQDVDLTGIHVIRANMVLKTPGDVPEGWAWRASIAIDGDTAGQALGWPKQTRRPDIVANVSKLSGFHTVALRLDLVEIA